MHLSLQWLHQCSSALTFTPPYDLAGVEFCDRSAISYDWIGIWIIQLRFVRQSTTGTGYCTEEITYIVVAAFGGNIRSEHGHFTPKIFNEDEDQRNRLASAAVLQPSSSSPFAISFSSSCTKRLHIPPKKRIPSRNCKELCKFDEDHCLEYQKLRNTSSPLM